MKALLAESGSQLALRAATAADLMTPSPVSIHEMASLQEAIALLTDKGFSAAPVIDGAGRPAGVLSRTDILIHDRENANFLRQAPEYFHRTDLTTAQGERLHGFQVERADKTKVRDVMTPVVFSVAPETPSAVVVSEMLSLKVHRLFVVDADSVLIGVISAFDILKRLE